ncbi:hypothetical protein Efla_005337 [Eimeria flavescens]
MAGNFYKGTSKEQTPFFKDKDSQLIAQRKVGSAQWPEIFEQEVDMSKVNVEVMKAWINHKITELLGFEDDIVISYCLSQLVPEEALAADVDERRNYLCPKKLAISLTGFVGKQATHFVRELWKLLLSAQNTPTGIPPEFLENRRLEMERKREEAARINEELVRRHEQMMATEFNKQIKQFATGTAPSKPPTLVAYDTIPDTGAGMRGWDNDDAPATRVRAADLAAAPPAGVAEHVGRGLTSAKGDGEAILTACLALSVARQVEVRVARGVKHFTSIQGFLFCDRRSSVNTHLLFVCFCRQGKGSRPSAWSAQNVVLQLAETHQIRRGAAEWLLLWRDRHKNWVGRRLLYQTEIMEAGHLLVYAAISRGKCVLADYVARHAPEEIPIAARQALLKILLSQQGRRSYVFQSHLFCFLIDERYVFLCVSPQEVSPDIANTFLLELRTSLYQRLAMRPSSPPPNMQEEATHAILQQVEATERGEGGGVQLITRVEKELEVVTDLVKDNINSVLERNEQIECLVGKTSSLKDDALSFRQSSRRLKRHMWCHYLHFATITPHRMMSTKQRVLGAEGALTLSHWYITASFIELDEPSRCTYVARARHRLLAHLARQQFMLSKTRLQRTVQINQEESKGVKGRVRLTVLLCVVTGRFYPIDAELLEWQGEAEGNNEKLYEISPTSLG